MVGLMDPLNLSARGSARPGTGLALGQQIKDQMRQSLMTVTKGADEALKHSARQKGLAASRQSVNVSNPDLKSALDQMKQGYKQATEHTPR
jgi:hypothetical protein